MSKIIIKPMCFTPEYLSRFTFTPSELIKTPFHCTQLVLKWKDVESSDCLDRVNVVNEEGEIISSRDRLRYNKYFVDDDNCTRIYLDEFLEGKPYQNPMNNIEVQLQNNPPLPPLEFISLEVKPYEGTEDVLDAPCVHRTEFKIARPSCLTIEEMKARTCKMASNAEQEWEFEKIIPITRNIYLITCKYESCK